MGVNFNQVFSLFKDISSIRVVVKENSPGANFSEATFLEAAKYRSENYAPYYAEKFLSFEKATEPDGPRHIEKIILDFRGYKGHILFNNVMSKPNILDPHVIEVVAIAETISDFAGGAPVVPTVCGRKLIPQNLKKDGSLQTASPYCYFIYNPEKPAPNPLSNGLGAFTYLVSGDRQKLETACYKSEHLFHGGTKILDNPFSIEEKHDGNKSFFYLPFLSSVYFKKIEGAAINFKEVANWQEAANAEKCLHCFSRQLRNSNTLFYG